MKRINTAAAATILAAYPLEAINEELAHRGLATAPDQQAGATLLAMGVRSLDEFAATAVNLSQGAIEAEALKGQMAKAFPEHKIGDRHGAHYLSLARTGSLQGAIECRYTPGKASRKAQAKAAAFDLSGIEDKQLAAMAKSAKGTALEAVITAEVTRRAEAAKEAAAAK